MVTKCRRGRKETLIDTVCFFSSFEYLFDGCIAVTNSLNFLASLVCSVSTAHWSQERSVQSWPQCRGFYFPFCAAVHCPPVTHRCPPALFGNKIHYQVIVLCCETSPVLGPVSVTAQKDLFSPRGEKTNKQQQQQKNVGGGVGEKGMKLIVTE